jgi:hypothetical protein
MTCFVIRGIQDVSHNAQYCISPDKCECVVSAVGQVMVNRIDSCVSNISLLSSDLWLDYCKKQSLTHFKHICTALSVTLSGSSKQKVNKSKVCANLI